jgi:hypothetical protein
MEDLPESVNRLASRLESLELRVFALEHPSEALNQLPVQELASSETVEDRPFAVAGGAFSVLGKALLGIAGAYLLRAVAESTSLPKPGVAAIAIAYAMFWLVWASRAPAGAWFASVTYACTSALILAPMLWELTLSFKVLSPEFTAGVLGAFVCVASALAWKRDHANVLWVAFSSAAVLAIALSIATHQLEPFAVTLLLMVLLCELASMHYPGPTVRPLVAAAADIQIWALIFIYAGPHAARTEYSPIGVPALLAPACALLLICGVSVIIKIIFLKQQITMFETLQTMTAFLLAAASVHYFWPRGGPFILGVLCLILCVAGYALVLAVFNPIRDRRNYQVISTWSAILLLAGCALCIPPTWSSACLSSAAAAATFQGVRLGRMRFQFHGLLFLLAASASSGLLDYALQALTGTVPAAPSISMYLAAIAALFCYAAGKFSQAEAWSQQALHTVLALVAIASASAMLVQGLMTLVALSTNPGAHHLAFVRTLIVCAAALVLAYSGAHWRRMELTRIGYATLALVAAKLVLEDLRHGHLGFIAASIFLFAVTLIAVPRIARMGKPV